MRLLYKNIYRFILTVSIFIGGICFFSGCSSYEDDMIGSFPFLEIAITDTTISNTTHKIQIPVNANREWTAIAKQIGNGNTSWISTTPTNEYKTLAITIQKNETESSRSAVITIKNSSSEQTASFRVEQEASSNKTHHGLLVLKNQQELDNNIYTYVNGAVIIGNLYDKEYVTQSKTTKETVQIQIGDYIYTVGSSSISNLSKLSKIKNISDGALYVLNTQVHEIPTTVFKNLKLTKLYLDWNKISQLDNLKSLSTIEELSISNNQISNIEPLSTLSNIQKLNIAGNQIKDISILSNMPQITHLILGESADKTNPIIDISVLNQLPALESVNFSGLTIDQKQIDHLNLPPNCTVSAEDLKGSPLPIITTDEPILSNDQLFLSGSFEQQDQDLVVNSCGFYYGTTKSLEDMTFKEATQSGNQFTATLDGLDINKRYYIYAVVRTTEGDALGELKTAGESIFVGNVFIKNSDDITNFQSNGYSSIRGTIIIGSSSIYYTPNSITAEIDNTTYYFSANKEITDISFLADLKQITGGVYIVNTAISNLTPLTQIDATPNIWAVKNQIESIPDLSSIQGLTTLNISMNHIENIENISLLTGLDSLYLGDQDYFELETNTIHSLTSLHTLSSLTLLDISGLPISSQDINDLRVALPKCTVYSEGMTAPQTPKVTTLEASDITTKDAILNGTIISQGDANITEYGFYFGQDTLNLEKIVISSPDVYSGSSFEYTVDNLKLNVPYFFKAFALNENGESIGEMMTFKAGTITYEGTVILRTQEEVNNFPTLGYDKINGNLIIGKATQGSFDGAETNKWIDGTSYYFGDTDITNLDSLVSLMDVTQGVHIICNKKLSDISPLSRFKETKELDLERSNNISDWTPISQITSLINLNIAMCDITDLSPLALLTNLTNLNCPNNQISDLSPLALLINLTGLTCPNNQISDLSPLAQLTNLTYLTCYNNQISDLSPLAQLINLNSLHLEHNQISDISALENCTSLTWLALSFNTIQNIDPLKNLSSLTNIYLNGLPITTAQVDELKTSLPNCTIDATDLKEYEPTLGGVTTVALNTETVTLQAEITDEGVSDITEYGFYYGTEDNLENMTKIQVDGQLSWYPQTYTYELSGLSQSTNYYLIAYASNASATTTSESIEFQTAGKPTVETVRVEASDSYVHGKASNSIHTSITSYGAVWSLVDEPTINSYLGINRVQTEQSGDVTWSVELTELKAGYTYNVRCFAENEYGLAYGEVIQYTAPGEPSKYNYTLNATIPNFEDGTSSPISALYTYSYKSGIASSGKAISPTSIESNKYVYPLNEGEQNLVFCNLNASSDNYQVEGSASQDMMFKIRQTSGENGLGTDIVTGTDSLTLTTDQEKTLTFKREVARLNLAVKASNKDGSIISNISELLSTIDISIDNFYGEIQILSNLKSKKGGNISNVVSSPVDETGYLQSVAKNIYTFPTIAEKKNKVDIQVEFKDGRSIQLSSFLPEVIEANKTYSITFTISENNTNSSFTLSDIEIIEEIIEF